MNKALRSTLIFLVLIVLMPQVSLSNQLPCGPFSEFIELADDEDPEFCSEWNPEFGLHGQKCCAKLNRLKRGRGRKCAPQRAKASYCDEMTESQLRYSAAVLSGKIEDVLKLISDETIRQRDQSYCTPSNGFLAWGRPVLSTPQNRLQLRSPVRCVNFGTDGMVGMLEWVGRKIATDFSEYTNMRLVVGDISAPRGGCLSGRGGHRGHASHTSGLDVDLAFLVAKKNTPEGFHQQFDPKVNWWLLKQVFKNPYSCVKVVFLDRRHIRKLSKTIGSDPDWNNYRRYIQHMPGHRNHFHIRIGDAAGGPGCGVVPKS